MTPDATEAANLTAYAMMVNRTADEILESVDELQDAVNDCYDKAPDRSESHAAYDDRQR